MANRQKKAEVIPKAKILLIEELLYYGKEGCGLNLIKDFLENRRMTDAEFEVDYISFAETVDSALGKLSQFKPDIVVIETPTLYKVSVGEIVSKILESEYHPKELVFNRVHLDMDYEVLRFRAEKKIRTIEDSAFNLESLLDSLKEFSISSGLVKRAG